MEKLKNIYTDYLRMYGETGLKPYLNEMLLILLLEEKDNFEPLKVTLKDYYRFYQRIIDEKVSKIKTDFKLTEEDIAKQKIQKKINSDEDIYYLIEDVIEIIHNYKKNPSKVTVEEIYYQYSDLFYENESTKKKKNLPKVLAKYRKVNGVHKWIPIE